MTERPRFSTWREFHEDSLHHPTWGYYTDGRVAFGEEGGSADDFTTFPVSMHFFGRCSPTASIRSGSQAVASA